MGGADSVAVDEIVVLAVPDTVIEGDIVALLLAVSEGEGVTVSDGVAVTDDVADKVVEGVLVSVAV